MTKTERRNKYIKACKPRRPLVCFCFDGTKESAEVLHEELKCDIYYKDTSDFLEGNNSRTDKVELSIAAYRNRGSITMQVGQYLLFDPVECELKVLASDYFDKNYVVMNTNA